MAFTGRLARGCGSVLLVAALIGAAPSPAHCEAAPDVSSHQHHDGPEQQPRESGECPHCPPVQCAAQTHCATVLIATAVPATASQPSSPSPVPEDRPPAAWPSHSSPPASPPPQPRG